MDDNLLLRTLTNHFRIVSNKVIGRVFCNLASHSCGFGMGKIKASLHPLGMLPATRQSFANCKVCSKAEGPRCCRSSYVNFDGPAALSLGIERITEDHSSREIGIIRLS